MRDYPLNPITTKTSVATGHRNDKPQARPSTPLPLSPAQPPELKCVKIGLDVHLLFTMVVIQREHGCPCNPRKVSPEELVL